MTCPPRYQFGALVILIVVVNLLCGLYSAAPGKAPATPVSQQGAASAGAPAQTSATKPDTGVTQSVPSGGAQTAQTSAKPAADCPLPPAGGAQTPAVFAPLVGWVITIGLLVGCFALIGKIPSGPPPPISDSRALLVDQRNRISLSRFQIVLWSLLVVSAIITEGTINAVWALSVPLASPLYLAIPKELWILLGLSSATAVAAPMVLGTKNDDHHSTIKVKPLNTHAWRDMFYGDQIGDYDQVDFSKVQQFFFTVVLVIVYAIEIAAILLHPAVAPPSDPPLCPWPRLYFPPLDPALLALIGVSQIAYISYKALPQSKTDATDHPPPP